MKLQIVEFNEVEKIISFAFPKEMQQAPTYYGNMWLNVDLWPEDAEEISGITEQLRKKWSDAALRDLVEADELITSDDFIELLGTRGMTVDVEA